MGRGDSGDSRARGDREARRRAGGELTYIEVRAPAKLRGPDAIDLAPTIESIMRAVREGTVDSTRLRVVLDWVQYRESFREPVSARAILPSSWRTAHAEQSVELAIDLRRATGDISSAVSAALNSDTTDRSYLEPWKLESESCIWEFNGLFWKYLALWEQATDHLYEQALPGGESAANDASAAREVIAELFDVWDDLAKRRALPDQLYVFELGVGNGTQARVWLDEFLKYDRELGRDYYKRLHYLMGDYSQHVLDRARATVAHHGERVSGLVIDARRPTDTLGFLRTKAFLVYISNVYDNLPSDEVVRMGGQTYKVEVRAYLPEGDAEKVELVHRLLRLGPELLASSAPQIFPTVRSAVEWWRDIWKAVRLEERYVPLEELDMYAVAPGVSGEILRPLLESHGDVRLHISNGAVASFVDTLPLLHPMGWIVCHDIFTTELHQFLTTFRGPGKYDGSVVNWVNGQVLAMVGRRRGSDVTFAPFTHRKGNVTTLRTRTME